MKCCRCASGELIRCYLLTHWNNLRLSLGFASAAVERVIDGFWLLVAFVITATLVKGMPEDLTIFVQIIGALLVIGTIAADLAGVPQAGSRTSVDRGEPLVGDVPPRGRRTATDGQPRGRWR